MQRKWLKEMDTKRKALGRGLEELFNSESLELSKIDNIVAIKEASRWYFTSS